MWALTGNLGREAPRGDGRKKRGTGRPNEAKREQKEGKRRGKESEKKRKERKKKKKFKSIVYVLLLRKRKYGIYKFAAGKTYFGVFTVRHRRKNIPFHVLWLPSFFKWISKVFYLTLKNLHLPRFHISAEVKK